MRSKSGNLTPKEYAQNLAVAALVLAQKDLRHHMGDGRTDENESFVQRADIQLAKIMDYVTTSFEDLTGGETNEDWTRDLYAQQVQNLLDD